MDVTGISTKKIAAHLHFEVSTIYKWISGKRLPDQSHFDQVIDRLVTLFSIRLIESPASATRFNLYMQTLNVRWASLAPRDMTEGAYFRSIKQLLTDLYLNNKMYQTDHRVMRAVQQNGSAGANAAYDATIDLNNTTTIHSYSSMLDYAIHLFQQASQFDDDLPRAIYYLTDDAEKDPLVNEERGNSLFAKINEVLDKGWQFHYLIAYKGELSDTTLKSILEFQSKHANMCAKSMRLDELSMIPQRMLVVSGIGAITYYGNLYAEDQFCFVTRDGAAVAKLAGYCERISHRFIRAFRPIFCNADYINYFYSLTAGELSRMGNGFGMMLLHDELFMAFLGELKLPHANKLLVEAFSREAMFELRNMYMNAFQSHTPQRFILSENDVAHYIHTGIIHMAGTVRYVAPEQRLAHMQHLFQLAKQGALQCLLLPPNEKHKLFGREWSIISNCKATVKLYQDPTPGSEGISCSVLLTEDPAAIKAMKAYFQSVWDEAKQERKEPAYIIHWLERQIDWLARNKASLETIESANLQDSGVKAI